MTLQNESKSLGPVLGWCAILLLLLVGSISYSIVSPLESVSAFPRAGIGISTHAQAELWSARLGASWYLNWRAIPDSTGSFPEHWKLIKITANSYSPPLNQIHQLALEHPGGVWVLGNEPDNVWQDNLTPEAYAQAYHELYQTIKESDPTALIAVAGISQTTPLRLEYLDRVLSSYQEFFNQKMPVDWWTVHTYILREEKGSWGVDIPPGIDANTGMLYEISDHNRSDLFEAQIRDFRAWLAAKGYRDTPLALTEFGILMPPEYGFPPEMVAQYLFDTFHLLNTMRDEQTGYPLDDNHLVQRWAWFSLSDPDFPTSNLADLKNNRLTPVGVAYRDFIRSITQP